MLAGFLAAQPAPADELQRLCTELQRLGTQDGEATGESIARIALLAGSLRASRRDAELRSPAVLQAIDTARRTIRGAKDSDDRQAWLELETASYLVQWGAKEVARQGLRDFFARRSRTKDPNALAWRANALHLLVQLEGNEGEFESALAFARQHEEAAKASKNPSVLATAHGLAAQVLVGMGDFEAASAQLQELDKSLAALRAAGAPDQQGEEHGCFIRCELSLGQDRPERVLAAIAEYRQTNPPSPRLELAGAIAELDLALRTGQQQRAVAGLEAVLAQQELDPDHAARAHLGLLRLALRRGDLAVASARCDTLRAALGEGPITTTLAAEFAAVRAHLARLRHAEEPQLDVLRQERARLREAFAFLLTRWAKTPLKESGTSFLAVSHRRRIIVELARLDDILEGNAAAALAMAQHVVAMQAHVAAVRASAAAAIQWDDVANEFVGEQRGLLALMTADNGSALLLVDGDGARVEWLPDEFAIKAAAKALRLGLEEASQVDRAASQEHAEACARQAQALADLVLPRGLRSRLLRVDILTVADFGLLEGAPWDALLLGDKNGQMLGEVVALNSLTALTVGVHWRHTRYATHAWADAGARLFGTLRGSPALLEVAAPEQPLLDRNLMEQLLAPYHDADPVLDGEATVAAVQARDAAVVTHFVAHGSRVGAGARDAGLALTPAKEDSGFLGYATVSALRSGPLVILSACRSGRPLRRHGEDAVVTTLGNAFFASGAHTVIQSMADLRLSTHLGLMQAVHAELAAGRATAVALRNARRARAATDDLAARFEHATLQVHGLGHLPVIEGARK